MEKVSQCKIKNLGQVFTPLNIVKQMLDLKQNHGTTLEPSVGNGAFFNHIQATGIEIDSTVCPPNCLNMDFFDYPTTNKFDTIIGNPPYVAYKNVTRKLDYTANLYVHFIHKCFHHLNNNGEIIFITPREFLKATSSINLNNLLHQNGTITHLIDLGDDRIFPGFNPNCIIWRYQKDNYSRKCNNKTFTNINGQLLFLTNNYTIPFKDYFKVKVGAVSGNDKLFECEPGPHATEFVCSTTIDTGKTKSMLAKGRNKEELLKRKIRKFDESNWWQWGRWHHESDQKRVYVNCKTRRKNPFFCHPCKNYDGSVLAIFTDKNEQEVANRLNKVDWNELGFVCDGRFQFSQRSLESTMLPQDFWNY